MLSRAVRPRSRTETGGEPLSRPERVGSSGRRSSGGGVRTALLLCVGLFAMPATLVGDEFRLKDGRRIEGTVVREIGDLISIKTEDGVITIDRSEIESRRETETPFDIYKERKKELGPDDLEGHVDLAGYCEANDLPDEAKLLYKRVIELEPNHQTARAKLGYVWFAGEWFIDGSPELQKRREEIAAGGERGADEPPPEKPRDSTPRSPKLPPLPKGTPQMALKLDEKIGKEAPTSSGASYTIASLCRSLKTPISASPSYDPTKTQYVMEVEIRTSFLKQVQFYNMPLTNVYQCAVEVGIGERNADGTLRRVGTLRFKKETSLASRAEKEKGLKSAYHIGVEELNHRLRTMPFFKKLGAKLLPEKDGKSR